MALDQPFCKYQNLFGKAGTGIHSYRFSGIAIIDFILTVLGAVIITWIFDLHFWWTLVVLLLLGIVIHRLFCVRTTLDKLIFSQDMGGVE